MRFALEFTLTSYKNENSSLILCSVCELNKERMSGRGASSKANLKWNIFQHFFLLSLSIFLFLLHSCLLSNRNSENQVDWPMVKLADQNLCVSNCLKVKRKWEIFRFWESISASFLASSSTFFLPLSFCMFNIASIRCRDPILSQTKACLLLLIFIDFFSSLSLCLSLSFHFGNAFFEHSLDKTILFPAMLAPAYILSKDSFSIFFIFFSCVSVLSFYI